MPKNSKIAWRSFSDAPASEAHLEADLDDSEPVAGVDLDAALAGLGCGRKQCRQLRAELRLEDDSFKSLQRCFSRDQRRVESALSRLLPKAAEQVICLLEVESIEGSPSPKAGPRSVPQPEVNEFEEVWKALPRTLPGMPCSSGQEERQRALRRRLKALLPAEAAQAVKQAQTQLREGLSGENYLAVVWKQLEGVDGRAELLVEMITSQAHDVQRVLRRAVEGQLPVAKSSVSSRATVRRVTGVEILILPEAYLFQMLSYCCSAWNLSRFGACCVVLRSLAFDDRLWRRVWQDMQLPRQVPESQVHRRLLICLASQCVECGDLTDFEHAILGCRLCETCERSHSRYALIRSSLAIREFQLPLSAMQQLPGVDGSTGRVYLRSMVQQLAERQHTQESLQQLRAKNDWGQSTCGRRRSEKRQSGMPKASKEDTDPCCFEATALRRADHVDEENNLQRLEVEAKGLPRSLRRNWRRR